MANHDYRFMNRSLSDDETKLQKVFVHTHRTKIKIKSARHRRMLEADNMTIFNKLQITMNEEQLRWINI